jgi:hypothetical protein
MILASLLVELLYVIVGSLIGCLIIGTIFGIPPHFSLIAGLVIIVLIVFVWFGMLWFSPSQSLDPVPAAEESDKQEQQGKLEKSLTLQGNSSAFKGYTSPLEKRKEIVFEGYTDQI